MDNRLIQQFPQIYRFITAGVEFIGVFYHQVIQCLQTIKSRTPLQKIFLLKRLAPILIVFIYLIFSNVYSLDDFEKAKLNTLYSPNSAQSHLALSLIFAKNNDLDQAIIEAKIARRLSPYNSTINDALDRFQKQRERPEKLKQKYNYWESVSSLHKDYRDAFLYQADLALQLKNTGLAKEKLQKALDLDPNNELLLVFFKLITNRP